MTESGVRALLLVVCGPSGTGKGTVVSELMERDDRLWLSRSWTTRPRRSGEPADAYVFVDRDAFDERIARGGFLEWAEVFGGNLYGTPIPEAPEGLDVVLEIDVQGAEQVKQAIPDAVVVLLLPPSREEQERRLRERGDTEDQLAERLAKADREEERAAAIADHTVVNEDLDRAVDEVAGILSRHRTTTGES